MSIYIGKQFKLSLAILAGLCIVDYFTGNAIFSVLEYYLGVFAVCSGCITWGYLLRKS